MRDSTNATLLWPQIGGMVLVPRIVNNSLGSWKLHCRPTSRSMAMIRRRVVSDTSTKGCSSCRVSWRWIPTSSPRAGMRATGVRSSRPRSQKSSQILLWLLPFLRWTRTNQVRPLECSTLTASDSLSGVERLICQICLPLDRSIAMRWLSRGVPRRERGTMIRVPSRMNAASNSAACARGTRKEAHSRPLKRSRTNARPRPSGQMITWSSLTVGGVRDMRCLRQRQSSTPVCASRAKTFWVKPLSALAITSPLDVCTDE